MAQWRRCLPLECQDLIQISRTYGKPDAEHTCINPSLLWWGGRQRQENTLAYIHMTNKRPCLKVKIKDWYLRLSFDLHTYTLPSNQALIPTTHRAANNHPQLQFQGIQHSPGLPRTVTACMWLIDIYVGMILIHKIKIEKRKRWILISCSTKTCRSYFLIEFLNQIFNYQS